MFLVKKILFVLLSVTIVGLILFSGSAVTASSWGYVAPHEVVERADVIVTGRYDFSEMAPSNGGYFVGFAFEVEHVYKGDVPRRIIAGIDGNDVSLSSEIQERGGSFLLLLEDLERYDYLVPVSGPNGMVPLSNGAVDAEYVGGEKFQYFTNFLNEQSPIMTYQTSTSRILYFILIGIGVIGLLVFIFYLFKKKKNFKFKYE